jgi:hypothetical protein
LQKSRVDLDAGFLFFAAAATVTESLLKYPH